MSQIVAHEDDLYRSCLAISVELPPEAGGGVRKISCFLFEVHDQWFVVTAEHIFIGADGQPGFDALAQRYPPLSVAFVSYLQQQNPTTSVALAQLERITSSQIANALRGQIEDADCEVIASMDLACLILPDYYVANLRATGIQPFTWNQVRPQEEGEAEEIARDRELETRLVGVPASGVKVDRVRGVVQSHLLLLPVALEHVEEPFSYWKPSWHHEDLPHDLHGASGGPIVVVGADKPYVIAIQIAQDRQDGRRRLKAVNSCYFFDLIVQIVSRELM